MTGDPRSILISSIQFAIWDNRMDTLQLYPITIHLLMMYTLQSKMAFIILGILVTAGPMFPLIHSGIVGIGVQSEFQKQIRL